MQSDSSRIWTCFVWSTSYDRNHYTPNASTHTHTHIKVKLVILFEGHPKDPFSIAVRGGATPFPGLLYFTFNSHLLMLCATAASSTIFWVFSMTRTGIEPRSPGPFANTLLIRPMARIYMCVGMCVCQVVYTQFYVFTVLTGFFSKFDHVCFCY